jgi:membrane protein DedA with SNARE-associated domain
MHWATFLAWNAAGGIVWATGIGLIAYFFGKAAADAISQYGLYGAGAAVAVAVVGLVGFHLWRKRAESS